VKASPYQGTILQVVSAVCRSSSQVPNFDWSETGILRNTITGKYVEVSKSVIDALTALPYQQSIIGGATNATTGVVEGQNGIVRVGAYGMTSFTTLFGF